MVCLANNDQEPRLCIPRDPGRGLLHRVRKYVLNVQNACLMLTLVRKNKYDLIQEKDNFSAAIVAR